MEMRYSEYAIVGNTRPYMLESQHRSTTMDIQRVDLSTGKKSIIGIKVYGRASVSPKGKYLFGYSRKDSTWFTYNLKTLKYKALTKGKIFYNELHDYPDDPRSYGFAGWTENDEEFLIYDRFDIGPLIRYCCPRKFDERKILQNTISIHSSEF